MKIAFLTSSYPRFPGDGSAPFIQSIAQALHNLGDEIEVVAPYDPLVRPGDTSGVVVHRFKYTPVNKWHIMGHARVLEADTHLRMYSFLLLPFFLTAAFFSLLRVARRQKADIIYAHWVLPNGVPAALVSVILRTPLVISLHGSDIYLARKFRLFGLAARWAFRHASLVTACSPELKQIALDLGAPPDTILLPYGADPALFNPAQRSEQKHASFQTRSDDLIISGIGRMVPKKGFQIAIEAFREVLQKCPQARLVLGGDGPMMRVLTDMAEEAGLRERVSLIGRVPWNEVPEFLASADIFVLPSVRDEAGNIDGLPNVLLEAMGCGVPVVASDISGVRTVLDDGENGLLAPSGDAHALAQALIRLIEDSPKRDRLGKAARQSIETTYNWEAIGNVLHEQISKTRSFTAIPSTDYDREYYTNHCGGFEEFNASAGRSLHLRHKISFDLAGLEPGMKIVDIGCGRGEIVYHCARIGCKIWGMDYSSQAVRIAADVLTDILSGEERQRYLIQQANARSLPFESEAIDIVFMLDIVEHLYPAELGEALQEVYRILKPGGLLVVHTIPNLWYYRYGYPVFRLSQALRGVKLPADPRKRWAYSHVHVNEQSPAGLKYTLDRAGFKTHVFLKSTQRFEHEQNRLVRRGMEFLAWAYPFRWIFCDDIFALGVKPHANSH
jgi:glycosyltransferase involved in cell wall biosynthesis/ubiquinone/menaquinone biosynthesis C-methylase UbiE